MTKPPAFQFYTGDWRKDPQLSLCTSATRGVWIDLICAMHDLDRSGELRGTAKQLAQLARCSAEEMALALTDLRTTEAADVTERNGVVTVRCRRMYREARARQSATERQKRRRRTTDPPETSEEPCGCHADVAEKSRSPSSTSSSPPYTPPPDGSPSFLAFWAVYPPHRKASQGKALEAWGTLVDEGIDMAAVVKAATEYAASPKGRGRYAVSAPRWLEDRCWLDDRASWQESGENTNGEEATWRPVR